MSEQQSYEGLQQQIRDMEMPEIEVLKTAYPAPGHEYTINIVQNDFTCVCPKTGQPDFGVITIQYIPDQLIMELKSLKEYLQAYRNVGVFHENLANKILHDTTKTCRPMWASVEVQMATRGGIDTTVNATTDYDESKYPERQRNAEASQYVKREENQKL